MTSTKPLHLIEFDDLPPLPEPEKKEAFIPTIKPKNPLLDQLLFNSMEYIGLFRANRPFQTDTVTLATEKVLRKAYLDLLVNIRDTIQDIDQEYALESDRLYEEALQTKLSNEIFLRNEFDKKVDFCRRAARIKLSNAIVTLSSDYKKKLENEKALMLKKHAEDMKTLGNQLMEIRLECQRKRVECSKLNDQSAQFQNTLKKHSIAVELDKPNQDENSVMDGYVKLIQERDEKINQLKAQLKNLNAEYHHKISQKQSIQRKQSIASNQSRRMSTRRTSSINKASFSRSSTMSYRMSIAPEEAEEAEETPAEAAHRKSMSFRKSIDARRSSFARKSIVAENSVPVTAQSSVVIEESSVFLELPPIDLSRRVSLRRQSIQLLDSRLSATHGLNTPRESVAELEERLEDLKSQYSNLKVKHDAALLKEFEEQKALKERLKEEFDKEYKAMKDFFKKGSSTGMTRVFAHKVNIMFNGSTENTKSVGIQVDMDGY